MSVLGSHLGWLPSGPATAVSVNFKKDRRLDAEPMPGHRGSSQAHVLPPDGYQAPQGPLAVGSPAFIPGLWGWSPTAPPPLLAG